jgi:glycosyltransferase involved in cell wall biosynthesis
MKAKNKPKISVIIPLYNKEKLIHHCLNSIYKTTYPNFEVIVVDDASTDNSVKIAERFPCKLIKLKKNMGVGYARNIGAKNAKGDMLYFVDSDVIQVGDNLNKIVLEFEKDPKLDVLAASLTKDSFEKDFGPSFLALKYFYLTTYAMIKRGLKRQKVTWLPTCSVAIKKSVFTKFGGFDTSLGKLGGEEYELGYRISKKHTIYIYRDIEVVHNRPTILHRAKLVFKRGIIHASLFSEQRKFEPVGRLTLKEAFITILISLATVTLLFGLLFPKVIILSLSLYLCALAVNSRFYYFILKQKNLVFMIKGIFADFVLYLSKGLGVSVGFLKLFFTNIYRRLK